LTSIGAFDLERLEDEASRSTGLHDFGAGDWQEGFEALVASAASEAKLNTVGETILHDEMLRQLINRLEITAWATRRPEVRDERIASPVILATLPRTGQTAAGWLLDRDPHNRALYTWLAKHPVPPPGPGANADDPRIARERASVAAMPDELRRMHLSDAEEPDECHWLISNAFRGAHQIYSMRVPSYYAWSVDRAEMGDAYAFYRLQLQLLQSRSPGRRWVLKNSPHLLHLDALNRALPGAYYVQFHRDPLAVLASNCQLAVLLRGMRSDHVDRHEIGSSILRLLLDYVERTLRFRDSGVTRPWVDVDFNAFVADPLREVERIYAALGFELSGGTRDAMARWVARNPRDSRRRSGDLREFGLDAKRVRTQFAEYSERFHVDA
jgi:hypothetical protein